MESSDGFESKKLGVPGQGTSPGRMTPGEHGSGRESGLSPFTGLGEASANLVEVHGVIAELTCCLRKNHVVTHRDSRDAGHQCSRLQIVDCGDELRVVR